MQTNRAINFHSVFLLAILILFLVFKLPLLTNASNDRNMVRTFDTDEFSAIVTIDKGINNWARTDFYYYGNVYPLVTILSLLPFKITNTLNDQTIIIALRSISLLTLVISVILLFYLGKKFFNPTAGIIAALLLLQTAEVNLYSTIAHADTLQILLVTLCLYYCLVFITEKPPRTSHQVAQEFSKFEEPGLKGYFRSRRNLLRATLFAGLAFGTKYVGIFLLPTLFLASALVTGCNFSKWKILLADLFWTGIVFGGAFCSTSPYHIINYPEFLRAIKITTFWVTEAFLYKLDANPFLWFNVFKSTDIMGPVLFYITAASLLFCAVRTYNLMVRNELTQAKDRQLLLLCFWVLSFFAYLFVRVRYRESRYLLPIVPFIYLVFAVSITSLWEKIGGWNNTLRKNLGKVALLITTIVILVSIKPNIDRAIFLKSDYLTRPESSAIKAGKWLEQNYPRDSVILFDMYSYIPISFKKTTPSYGMFQQQRDEANPDLIIVHRSISSRFEDPEKAKNYAEGPKRGIEIHSFYKRLSSGDDSGFILKKDFGDVQIYTRR